MGIPSLSCELQGDSLDPQTQACLRMWAAVFHQGLTAVAKSLKNGDTLQDSANLRWFFVRGDDLFYMGKKSIPFRDVTGSFTWLCALMGFDADQARDRALSSFATFEMERVKKNVDKTTTEIRHVLESTIPLMETSRPEDEGVKHRVASTRKSGGKAKHRIVEDEFDEDGGIEEFLPECDVTGNER